MKQTKTVSIIIITFNSEKQIDKCLKSIFRSVNSQVSLLVTIIDNNSSDGTLNKILSNYSKEISKKKIVLISQKANLGFSASVNIGISQKKSSYYILLNPDVYISQSTIGDVISFSEAGNYDIVGVRMIDEQKKYNGSYFRFPNLLTAIFEFTNLGKLLGNNYWHNYFYYKDLPVESVKNVDVVTGGFMLIKNKVVEKIGVLDQKYFMYLEDVDYSLRAKKAGFSIGLCDTTVVHIGGASSNNKDHINHNAWYKSRRRYFLKNFDLLSNILVQPIFLVDELAVNLFRLYKIIKDALKSQNH